MFVVSFLSWTLLLYCVHRALHVWRIPFVTRCHFDHHKQVTKGTNQKGQHWTNYLLFYDSWRSTVDQWITEVIPTIAFCAVTGEWWIAAFYYIWAAFIQERLEHNSDFDLYPWMTSGKYHMVHHQDSRKNFGAFFPIWDILFGTNVKV